MEKNNKIWQKGLIKPLEEQVEKYTVGSDYLFDQRLVKYDAQASIAHAEMLAAIGILTTEEKDSAVKGLNEIIALSEKGEFVITVSHEDCHSAIEQYLTEHQGEVGKKIHTGRSRNDQVLVAMRLYMKDAVIESKQKIENLISELEKKAAEYKNVEMPGYTHMQRAMPSSVDMWLGSFSAALTDDLSLLEATLSIIDQNPLGSVVAYGEKTLGLDRAMTTKALGFTRVQENPMYCALSRGKFETLILQALLPVLFDIGKFATDMMLFTTKEFGFVRLPSNFTTGSSAMPQKRNYDVCELMRAHCAGFAGNVVTLQNIIDKLPSGYNRDFQLAKAPFMTSIDTALETISIATLVAANISINTENAKAACTPELYATEEAYKMVKEDGVPFRDAYKIVAEKYLPKE